MRIRIKKKIEEMEEKKRKKLFKKLKIKEEPKPEIVIKITESGKYNVSQIPNVNSVIFQEPFKYRDEQRHKIEKKIKKEEEEKKRKDELEKEKEKKEKEKLKEDLKEVIIIKPDNEKKRKILFSSLMGDNFPSKYRSNSPIKMTGRYKEKDSRENYPGPGSYLYPSEFGIYRSKKAGDYPEENVYPEKKKHDEEAGEKHKMKKIKIKDKKEEEKKEEDKEEKQEKEKNEDNQDKSEKQIPKEEPKNEKEEDKESECKLLRDILTYSKN